MKHSSRSSGPEVFCKKGVLRNFTKFTGKHLFQSLFFKKVAGLSPATLLKTRLWHRFLPVFFMKFLTTSFFYRTPPVAASGYSTLSAWHLNFCQFQRKLNEITSKFYKLINLAKMLQAGNWYSKQSLSWICCYVDWK